MSERSGCSRFRASRWFRPLAIAVPVVVVLGAGLAVFLPWELSKVAVPDLAGQTLSQAATELGSLQLTLQAGDGTSPDLAGFTAIDSQQPAAGSRVVPDTVVTVVSHLLQVAVPDLSGKSYSDASAALEAAGLRVGQSVVAVPADLQADPATIQAAFAADGITIDGATAPGAEVSLMDPSIAAGWPVMAQDPAAGATVTAGASIALTATVPFVPVPDVGGKPHDDAIAALQSAGFDTSEITTDGVVTAQSPAAGTPWIAGTKVGATLQHYVEYQAEASTRTGWLQWQEPGSSEIQIDDAAKLPWSQRWWDTTSYGHLVVAWKFVGSGTATCRIIVDGKVVSEQSFTGLTPNVTCG